jgi:hypothetical protein
MAVVGDPRPRVAAVVAILDLAELAFALVECILPKLFAQMLDRLCLLAHSGVIQLLSAASGAFEWLHELIPTVRADVELRIFG